MIRGFTVRNCYATEGGGVFITWANLEPNHIVIDRCIINNNNAYSGGGVYAVAARPSITNCIIMNNSATYGPGVYHAGLMGAFDIYNTIIYDELIIDDLNYIYTYYCLFLSSDLFAQHTQNLYPIVGNPQLISPYEGNYHLEPTSPCINAGDPTFPLDPDSTIVDIGVYPLNLLSGDLNFNNAIDVLDIVICVNIVIGELDIYYALRIVADMNDDWEITIQDILLIIDIILGW